MWPPPLFSNWIRPLLNQWVIQGQTQKCINLCYEISKLWQSLCVCWIPLLIVRSWQRKYVFISKIVFWWSTCQKYALLNCARQLTLLLFVTTDLINRGKDALPVWVGICSVLKPKWTVCSHLLRLLHMWTDSCVSICDDKQPVESGECFGGKLRQEWWRGEEGRGWKGWNFRFLWQYWIAGQECTPRLGWEALGGFGKVIWGMCAGPKRWCQRAYVSTFANH